MSTITERLLTKFERWLDRMLLPETRYICGGCDDRFQTRFQGVEHMLRCHPEYQGVVVYESVEEKVPAAAGWRPTWTNRSPQAPSWHPDHIGAGDALPALAYQVHADL